MCHKQYVVLINTNATNKGNPEIRAFVVDGDVVTDEYYAHDINAWLLSNGIQAEVVTLEKYHQKLANYRERVAAAS